MKMHIKEFMTKEQRVRLLFEAILKHSNEFSQWTTAEIQEYEEILNREENKRAY